LAEDEPWTNLGFEEAQAVYQSPSQNARALTEAWVAGGLFCPNCGAARLRQFAANSRVADFWCDGCSEEYEIKAKSGRLGRKVVDGAYGAMMQRLAASNNPNLAVMTYDRAAWRVSDLFVVPRQFFVPKIIERRKPLAATARRAGWVGCNILIGEVPEAGKVHLVRGGVLEPKDRVLDAWKRTLFLRAAGVEARGWLIEVMKCVEGLGRPEFELADVYAFEDRLSRLYPGNHNVRPKIRQQLQVLRDQGYLDFLGRGLYRLRD